MLTIFSQTKKPARLKHLIAKPSPKTSIHGKSLGIELSCDLELSQGLELSCDLELSRGLELSYDLEVSRGLKLLEDNMYEVTS